MHGLTFIALAQSPTSQWRWREDVQRRAASLDRHKRAVLVDEHRLTADERRLLEDIEKQLADPHAAHSSRKCPECRGSLTIVRVQQLEIECCRRCRGMWFDPGELQVFSAQSKEIPSDDLAHRASRFACPVCGAPMIEYTFVNPNSLLVDRCPSGHGVYLEERELERVFELT
jgi:Zn-finger nucleic acid-binding protein